jgi:hypothetical protein
MVIWSYLGKVGWLRDQAYRHYAQRDSSKSRNNCVESDRPFDFS